MRRQHLMTFGHYQFVGGLMIVWLIVIIAVIATLLGGI